ncbi:MAG: 4-hydroxythreonine-4-phosphate dehydrogenase PdxA [Clostridia bacterium]|nr:4-hydroxythreonine-4-phosphate dehydrogenase PdxA [Clostridia bacterium]
MNEKFKPVTAITMGDPAGIGPEIVVGTMLDEGIHECCRPFVIGSIAILDRAAKILGKELKYNRIGEPSEALFQYGTVDVLETGDYDTDSIQWGEVQELAGRMSVDWIMKSIELGMEHKVDAVSTAPIHKRAIKLAGVKQPGHTEIYQDETHSPYALTMFSCHKLRVFFVSRHMSLVDACRYATKERVLEFVENIDKELRKTGIEKPLIAVAALNPHGGDNGLFGTEEIEQLIPAVEAARAEGINAVGPVPADSVFHIGKSGKYDAILSLYHDQGHIACKTLDFEKSVTLTFGLPFIRSSVDHGTAFDIAGKGIAGSISLIESTKVVAEYAALMHGKMDQ